jgi:hypothetical protein
MTQKKTTPKAKGRKVAEALCNGSSIKAALVSVGVAEKQARKGMSVIRKRKGLREGYKERVEELLQTGDMFDPKMRARLLRAALVENVLEGKDKATQSLKMLGQDNEVNVFQPENVVGMTVIQVPPDWAERFAPKQIEGDEQ